MIRGDPDGVQAVREKLEELYPKLTYVASQSMGAVIGDDKYGQYGRSYYVSLYTMSTAFLATEAWEVPAAFVSTFCF